MNRIFAGLFIASKTVVPTARLLRGRRRHSDLVPTSRSRGEKISKFSRHLLFWTRDHESIFLVFGLAVRREHDARKCNSFDNVKSFAPDSVGMTTPLATELQYPGWQYAIIAFAIVTMVLLLDDQ
nr:hypothetical protein CFP56_71476 [Quercus suber]